MVDHYFLVRKYTSFIYCPFDQQRKNKFIIFVFLPCSFCIPLLYFLSLCQFCSKIMSMKVQLAMHLNSENGYNMLSRFKSNKDLVLKSLKSFKLLRISAKFSTNPSNPSIIKSASSSISKKLPHHCTPFQKPHYHILLGCVPRLFFEM